MRRLVVTPTAGRRPTSTRANADAGRFCQNVSQQPDSLIFINNDAGRLNVLQ
ncbi:MAG TPA: hypothetical protein VGO31_10555 [Microbacteriaceae bacterium]|nr:hypothetical protein [Microbacteriaceae bacterium]